MVWVSPAEDSEYKKVFEDAAPGAEGPGGQVSAMLKRAPRGSWVIILDDNIKKIRFQGKAVEPEQLMSLLRQGMTTPGLRAFAAVPHTGRVQWGRTTRAGLTIRQAELTGGLFALKMPAEMSGEDYACLVEPRHGHIADNLERSLRVYHEGGPGCIGLFHELTVEKWHEPGLWKKGRGGIAHLYRTAEAFRTAKEQHLDSLCEEFPEILRRPITMPVDMKVQSGWSWAPRRGW